MQEIFVADLDEIADGDRRVIENSGIEIGVFRLDDRYYAWESNCPHQGGPVCQGRIMKRVNEVIDERKHSHGYCFVEEDVHIVCPWHGFEFNIRTGQHPGDPQTKLRGFEIAIRDGGVYVRVE